MEVLSTIQLLVFPRDDRALESRLSEIATEANGWDHVAPDYLQQRLRAFYPNAVVRKQVPLGGLDGRPPAWYIYRDGSARTDP
jgi:hypothetical protein